MKRNWLVAGVMMLALLVGPAARSADEQATQSYTTAEYNAYQAAVNEKDATLRARLLDDFATKNPNSTLLPYVIQSFYRTYAELRNFLKLMEYADKLLAFGEKVDTMPGLETARLEALEARARVFFLALNQRQLTTNDQFSSARAAAEQGLKFVDLRKKPEAVTEDQFKQQNNALRSLFFSVGGFASRQQKDYKGAIGFFQGALAITPNDPALYYQIGLSSLQQDPPQQLDGYWAIARAIALKVQGEVQVRNYLKSQLNRFQLPTCDSLIDAQLNELIALAGSSAERPASFTIPSRADLDKVMQEATVDVILNDLKGGGDRAKIVWLAVCGAAFPELGGKVFEVTEADGAVLLKVFTVGDPEEIRAGTAPNMEIRIDGQPEAKRLKKDDEIVYSAELKAYTPDPFIIRLDKAKVQAEYLPPEEKTPPKKATPSKKAPVKRPPAKRPPASGAAH